MPGGARKGAGRRRGSVNKRAAALWTIREEVLTAGMTPLAVMLDNMRYYADRADQLQADIERLPTEDKADAALPVWQKLYDAHNKAQACALAAAPFVHPRLHSVREAPRLCSTHGQQARSIEDCSGVFPNFCAGFFRLSSIGCLHHWRAQTWS